MMFAIGGGGQVRFRPAVYVAMATIGESTKLIGRRDYVQVHDSGERPAQDTGTKMTGHAS
jgi:hypothetical protein